MAPGSTIMLAVRQHDRRYLRWSRSHSLVASTGSEFLKAWANTEMPVCREVRTALVHGLARGIVNPRLDTQGLLSVIASTKTAGQDVPELNTASASVHR